jgi:hypothetical protein
MYEKLIRENKHLKIREIDMSIKGLYKNGVIGISSRIDTNAERTCILAEEIGHHETSYGNILNQKDIVSVKQEKRARRRAHDLLIEVNELLAAYKAGCRNRYEVAEFLNITEQFLEEAYAEMKERYGMYLDTEEYIIYFEPIAFMRKFKTKEE